MEKVIVLGASGGIGSAVARELVGRGAELFLAGRNEEKLTALGEELGQPIYVVDATDFEGMNHCFQEGKSALSEITGVVNCVGSVLLKPAHLTSEEEWRHTLETNLTSAFLTIKYGIPFLRETKGSMVLLSTGASTIGLVNHEAIAAAKGGINGLILSTAATYGAKGVRVNGVAPGLVETELTKSITENDASKKFSLKMHPLGRLGTPEDISSAVCWLLSPEQSWVTGQLIAVDGGLSTLKLPV